MFKKKIRTTATSFFIFLIERKWKQRLKYLFFKNHSERLIIVFSGFPSGEKPLYNYIRTLKDIKADKLFILDDFGHRGSYYLMENGSEKPKELCCGLIDNILRSGDYQSVIMLGSSKGGTAAIYYGLQFNATAVYAGANQYYIGDYLSRPEFAPIVEGMTGKQPTKEVLERLNLIMPQQVASHRDSQTIIHLLYSKNEHTYKEHIEGMIADLRTYNIHIEEKVESFANHSEVGKYFSPYLKNEL